MHILFFGLYMALAQEPPCTVPALTLPDVIDFLVDYSLTHGPAMVNRDGTLYGITIFDERRIVIYDSGDRAEKRDTVIHELLHVYHKQRQENPSEDQVECETQLLYRKLFIAAPAAPASAGDEEQ